jgi:hypothetical protein
MTDAITKHNWEEDPILFLFEKKSSERRLIHEFAEKNGFLTRSLYSPISFCITCDNCFKKTSTLEGDILLKEKENRSWNNASPRTKLFIRQLNDIKEHCPSHDTETVCVHCKFTINYCYPESSSDMGSNISPENYKSTGEMLIMKRSNIVEYKHLNRGPFQSWRKRTKISTLS